MEAFVKNLNAEAETTGNTGLPDQSAVSFFAAPLREFASFIAKDFSVPVAVVSLNNGEDIVTGSNFFLPEEIKNRLHALADVSDDVVIFKNDKQDPWHLSFPFSTANTEVDFYAVAPLTTKEGDRLGFLSLFDCGERKFSQQDQQRLKQYARMVAHQHQLINAIEQERTRLLEKEARLKQSFKMVNIGSWEYDVRTKQASYSDELFELYGIDKSTAKKKAIASRFLSLHEGDLAALEEKTAHPDDAPFDTTEKIVRPNGTIVFLNGLRKVICDKNGNPVKVIGVLQDITAQLVNEEKLRQSEERFRALVQNNSDMTAVLDEKGNIKYISPTSLAISGYAPEELIGQNVFSFMHEDDMAELVAELQNVANSTNTGEPTLHRFRNKSGEWIWLESKGMNMMKNSHIGGIIINAREVTERIHLEEQLAKEEQNRQRAITSAVIKAQEAERSQIGRELHDNVNQVLTTVKLYTEMICDGIGDQKELVKKAGRHLQDCIDEIRSISKRLSAPTLGEISLEDSIKELIESINITNRIEIVYTGQGIDGLQIAQEIHLAIYRIIQEQLNNIIRYANATQVIIAIEKKGEELSLSITDNGKGFDLATKRTGIGITNMRTRAENLNGVFQLKSAPGEGCQLEVHFPLLPGNTLFG